MPPSTVSSAAEELDAPRRTVAPERRTRLRRIVASVIGVAALFSTFAVARVVRTNAAKSATAMSTTQLAIDMPVTPSIELLEAPSPAASTAPQEPALAPAPEPVVAAAPAPEPAVAAAGDAPALKREARSLVNSGRMRNAIPAAEAAIEADPTDAESYLLLGAALQETGQWKRSIEVFSRCANEATHGPRGECRALGGR